MFQPESSRKTSVSLTALLAGILSTQIIMGLHPVFWPEVDFKPRRTSLLTQTVHIAFIQAGMMEETFKILLILAVSFIFCFNRLDRTWTKDAVLAGGFTALGFSLVENYVYIHKDPRNTIEMFIGRTVFSSNIHFLINLVFALFLLKSNKTSSRSEKAVIIGYAYGLAVVQHGVVDFFLIPGSRFGNWLASALFIGIWVWAVRDLRVLVYGKVPENVTVDISDPEPSETVLSAAELEKKYRGTENRFGWFEELYSKAGGNPSLIPWEDGIANPNLTQWAEKTGFDFNEKTCLVIGCGLGRDAEFLAGLGARTDAFDISESAIRAAKSKFPDSKVSYFTRDLFDLENLEYDFVLESYTVQTFFEEEDRKRAAGKISGFVAEGGHLLLIARGREESEKTENPPFPLSKSEVMYFENFGLRILEFEDYNELEPEGKLIRRFRVLFVKD